MKPRAQPLADLDREAGNGFGLLRAGHAPFEPKWQHDAECAMGGWHSDIHGTLMAPVTTDWSALKPYTYLNVFLPDDSNDPQYGFVYAGKDEEPNNGRYPIVDRTYSGSPGKSNEWRAIVNRASPDEIYKFVVGVYETVEECRAAEKRLIEYLWDNFGRVSEGGIVTNLTTDPFDGDRNLTPEECRAMSERMKGRPTGKGQPTFIREADGTEHELGSEAEAIDLVIRLTGMGRKRTGWLVRNNLNRNAGGLKVHEPTGLLICYLKDKDKPVRKTVGDRLVRLEDKDGGVEVITADDFMERFDVTRHQLTTAVDGSNRKGNWFRHRYLVTWNDGEKQQRQARLPVYDRATGQRYDAGRLASSGFHRGSAYQAAKTNQAKPFVCSSITPSGVVGDFHKTYFVFAADLGKPIVPSLREKPLALLLDGAVDGAEIFSSSGAVAKTLGLRKGAAMKAVARNSAYIASGKLPKVWRRNVGTHVPVYLHELPAYCEMTGQEMPFSLVPYVAEIAQWQAENPHPTSKAAHKTKGLIMAPGERDEK